MTADMRHREVPKRCHVRCTGQSVLEYAVLIGVVAAALVAMQLYVRRSIQANLKALEDQVNAEAVTTGTQK